MELERTELERFELLDPIAHGATGKIFEARDREDGARCAVKVIDPKLASGARFETILNAEAPGAVAFRHENAARTLFAGKTGGHTIIATELLQGHTLDEWIQRTTVHPRPLPWELMTYVGLQVVQVLRVAHQTPWAEGESKGMFHCSISPHAIFILPDGRVRLIGVGLGRSRMCLPPSRHKLPYRAPELFERQKPDELTDIYSLGVTLYDSIARARLYRRDTVAEIKDAILDENPPSLRLERPEIDPAIDDLILDMMSKFPRTRPPLRRVEEVLKALSRRRAFSQSALAEAYADLFGGNGHVKRTSRASEDPSGFYPEYDIDDLVDKLIASKKTATPPPRIEPDPLAAALDLDGEQGNPFDVDAVVNAIVAGAKAPVKPTPPPRTPPPVERSTPPRKRQITDEQLYAGALSALEDGERSFDVDAIVNAIVSSGRKTPKPRVDTDEVTLPQVPVRAAAEASPASRGIGVKTPPRRTPRQIIDENTEPRGEVIPPEIKSTADVLTAPEALRPGDIIGDRYRVIDMLGEGGMSVVYRVEHTLLLKQMALKLLRSELSSLPSVVERFQLEARSVCQLDDPNIVRVTDFGRQPNGSLYLVMDYLTGESLAERLRRETKLPPLVAVDIATQILSGLSHAHRFGVVHRDLKPENIMLVPKFDRTQVKILDFGIAKLAAREQDDSAKPITQAGTVFGTPRYMSPEQASAEPVDLRADLYAVGVILYECLSGVPPFDGPSAVKILAKVLTEDPPPLNLVEPNPKVGAEIEAVVMQALQKEKEDRFPTADAFHAALLRAVTDAGPAR